MKIKLAAIGLITGITNGLFGSGGGSVLVPAMQKFMKIETHKSHATALAVILPLSVLSVFIYTRGSGFDLKMVLLVSAGGAAGGYIGANLLNKISSKWLHKIFGLFMVAAAIRMIFK